jgi:hypothetical protein
MIWIPAILFGLLFGGMFIAVGYGMGPFSK